MPRLQPGVEEQRCHEEGSDTTLCKVTPVILHRVVLKTDPRRKPLMVPKTSVCEMWNASLSTFVVLSASSCSAVAWCRD